MYTEYQVKAQDIQKWVYHCLYLKDFKILDSTGSLGGFLFVLLQFVFSNVVVLEFFLSTYPMEGH